MVHHKATSGKRHHKAKNDDDSPRKLHERLTIDEIMHKEFGYSEEYKDVVEKIQEVKEMNSEDTSEFVTKKKAKAYDRAILEILNGRAIPEVHDAVVDQEQAEQEGNACEKRDRERLERELLSNSPIRRRAEQYEAQETGSNTTRESKVNLEEMCCCIDRSRSDNRSCPNRRPPKTGQLGEQDAVHQRPCDGPRYNSSKENRMLSPRAAAHLDLTIRGPKSNPIK
eukprot:gnl/MRDRNA2_/MRDRNA2_93513_c0_seq1.p1 gnl/MRDRNA2_/MRDRNA2_93513_c0~~gnl/MRDRNA2_/MRDRNA2_93513_c0_seq1.p1  ORF type:complete len:252 (-),score=40.39 gnl/MRDRNA2_/MRDRNA2_93513_c0_seq1:24-698(-)